MKKTKLAYDWMFATTARTMVFSVPLYIVVSILWGILTNLSNVADYFTNIRDHLLNALIGAVIFSLLIYPIDKFLASRKRQETTKS